jgi:hypothetical protein
VQRLVDAAVVIIAMVVPALCSQFLQEVLDHFLPPHSLVFEVYLISMSGM